MSEVLIWRIIGNEIEGRHANDCMYRRLEHILINEDEFDFCTKRYLINRVFDSEQAIRLRDLLMYFKADYSEIPFQADVYRTLPEDSKASYLTNQAEAKNYCLDYGEENGFNYVIPADSSVLFSRYDAEGLFIFVDPVHGIAAGNSEITCLRVGRHTDFPIGDAGGHFEKWELPSGMTLDCPPEPQLMFRSDSETRYDTKVPYGFVNLEMLTRLSISGPWDRLPMVDTEVIPHLNIHSSGTCSKLPSWNPEIDLDGLKRYSLRSSFAKSLAASADKFLEGG